MAKSELHVTGLRIYPVKSMAGNPLDAAQVLPWGLEDDRRWALVDDAGANLTARRINELLGLRAEISGDTAIRITDREGRSINVDAPLGGSTIPVGFSRLDRATPVSRDVDEWISERVGRRMRLVWQEKPTARSIATEHGGLPGDPLSLADTAPLLLVTEASMQQLNEWFAADDANAGSDAMDIVRFRPNVIVDGDVPFAEDDWSRLRIGDVQFRRTELCDRCSMPTIDPTTLSRDKEPTRTLAKHRLWDHNTWFGIRIAPVDLRDRNDDADGNATINVGDTVSVEVD